MSRRALVVDDDESVRRVAKRMLERLEFVVDVASSAAEGERAARGGRFALVLLDVQLPDLDGPLAAEAIRAAAGLPAPAIVMMSGGMDRAMRERAMAAGARACLTKPFTLDGLRAVARRSAASRPPPPPAAVDPSPDPDPSALLDAAAGDKALLARFVETFLRDAATHTTAFVIARAAHDDVAAKRRMHQLAGAAGMVGAANLSALARALHDHEVDAPSVETLKLELARVATSLRALLDR